MIILNRKNATSMRNLGFGMLAVVVAIVALSIVMGSIGFFEAIAAGALFGGGLASIFGSGAVSKRYATYFNEESVKTIAEIASELGLKEKKVAQDLQYVAKRADRKKLKKCENVKFEA